MKEQIEKQAIEEMAECLIYIQQDFNEYCAKPCRECEMGGIVNCENHYKAGRLYNAGYRKQEWISVEDRLPDGQGHFLTVDDTGYIMVAMWTNQFGWFSHICKANKITHWMPLPEPPKMKGGAKQ